MQIANGIRGIRKHREDNNAGWHIFINRETYYGFVPGTLSDVLSQWSNHYTLIGIQGNTLSVTCPPND